MRKTILILITGCLTVFAFEANAQKRQGRRALGALKMGVGIASFSPLDAEEGGSRIGFHIGLAPAFSLSDNFYIKPEVAYSLRGGKADYDLNNLGVFDGEITYKINYLEFPVMLGYKVTDRFHLEFGAYGSIPLVTNFEFEGDFASGYGSFDQEAIHDFDYGLAGGVKLGPIGIRYYYGLSKVASNLESEAFLGDATQHTIQIYLQRSRSRRF